jgi:SagB-type dehydrogenase family enzyme
VHPVAAEILSVFDDWLEPPKAVELLGHLTPDTVAEAVDVLAGAGLLLAEDSPAAALDDEIAQRWATWAPEAAFFHYGSQLFPEEQEVAAEDDEPVRALPPMFTSYPDAERVLLPRRPVDFRVPYDQVLYARTTHRDFTSEPVSTQTFATLMSAVFGPVDYIDSGRGALFRRTSPAGGSRQEIDAYVGVLNVAGVDPGVYHYNIREHSLELRSPGLTPDEVVALCTEQPWTGGAAFVVFLAAVIDKMSYKYRLPRTYRVTLLNAGHLGQTFALTATALGLGPAQTGAFYDEPVARRCGIDNTGTTPVYTLLAGHPKPGAEYGPPPARMATFGFPTTLAERT